MYSYFSYSIIINGNSNNNDNNTKPSNFDKLFEYDPAEDYT